jgi:hypothetical protein
MSNFTYESSTAWGYIVKVPEGTRIKAPDSYRKILGVAFKVTKGYEVTVLTAENRFVTISLNLYAQLPDDDRYGLDACKHVIGVVVDTEEQAIELTYQLDKMRTWSLLIR